MRQSPRLASQVSTERILHRLDTRLLDRASPSLQSISWPASASSVRTTRLVALVRVLDILGRHVADDALRQRLDDVFAFLQRADLEAEDRAAILLGDRHVLRHVDETTRQVTGVGRLERRVGQTLTSAVRRDEVLEHRQAFTEVRLDRAFDDFTDATGELLLRLRHQSAHTRELTDLVAATTRAGVEHHEHRVEAGRSTRAWSSPSRRRRRSSRASRCR